MWDREPAFFITTKVVETDIDSYQHVNNSVYVRWTDECARAHSASVGIDPADALEHGYGMVVRESQFTYYASAHLGDEILIGNWVTNVGKLRATRQFQIIQAKQGLTLVRATIEYVCINLATERPTRMPPLFQKHYLKTPIPS